MSINSTLLAAAVTAIRNDADVSDAIIAAASDAGLMSEIEDDGAIDLIEEAARAKVADAE